MIQAFFFDLQVDEAPVRYEPAAVPPYTLARSASWGAGMMVPASPLLCAADRHRAQEHAGRGGHTAASYCTRLLDKAISRAHRETEEKKAELWPGSPRPPMLPTWSAPTW